MEDNSHYMAFPIVDTKVDENSSDPISNTVNKEQNVTCNLCCRTFSSEPNLQSHINNSHPKCE